MRNQKLDIVEHSLITQDACRQLHIFSYLTHENWLRRRKLKSFYKIQRHGTQTCLLTNIRTMKHSKDSICYIQTWIGQNTSNIKQEYLQDRYFSGLLLSEMIASIKTPGMLYTEKGRKRSDKGGTTRNGEPRVIQSRPTRRNILTILRASTNSKNDSAIARGCITIIRTRFIRTSILTRREMTHKMVPLSLHDVYVSLIWR